MTELTIEMMASKINDVLILTMIINLAILLIKFFRKMTDL